MFHLLELQYDADHTYDHLTYVVLTQYQYDFFMKHTGKRKFGFSVCSGHGNDSTDEDDNCRMINSMELDDHMGEKLSKFMNDSDMYRTITEMCEKYQAQLVKVTLGYSKEYDACETFYIENNEDESCGDPDCEEEIFVALLRRPEYQEFRRLDGKERYNFSISRPCLNGHMITITYGYQEKEVVDEEEAPKDIISPARDRILAWIAEQKK